MNGLELEILDRVNDIKIDCPDCEYIFGDEQYTCTTCWCEGGQGELNIIEFLKSIEWCYDD